MNLLHMKYALAVARTNSINKAAEELYISAPALSRAIKELEIGLGVDLFKRSAKGMFLTADGELFIQHAEKALDQIDEIKSIFKNGSATQKLFTISVPRASYIASAFVEFSKKAQEAGPTILSYRETNAYRVIRNLIDDISKLGIVRYCKQYDPQYRAKMAENGLVGDVIAEFSYDLLCSKDSPLATAESYTPELLENYTEIAHADPYVPSLPDALVRKDELPEHKGSRIYTYQRSSTFELLSGNPNTYMWVSPVPRHILDRYGLVQRKRPENTRVYCDVLMYRGSYKLSELDEMFLAEVFKARDEAFR